MKLSDYVDHDFLERYRLYIPRALAWRDAQRPKSLGVGANTIRAIRSGFRGKQDGPLVIYDEWASAQRDVLRRRGTEAKYLDSVSGFAAWHAELTRSLSAYWFDRVSEIALRRETSTAAAELSLPHKYKLVDLFVRWVSLQSQDLGLTTVAPVALNRGHIPLDKKSLHVISRMYSGIALGEEFSMGMIKTERQYRLYQDLARNICSIAGGSPLVLDVFAWNLAIEDVRRGI